MFFLQPKPQSDFHEQKIPKEKIDNLRAKIPKFDVALKAAEENPKAGYWGLRTIYNK
jgi:hypothetical protein